MLIYNYNNFPETFGYKKYGDGYMVFANIAKLEDRERNISHAKSVFDKLFIFAAEQCKDSGGIRSSILEFKKAIDDDLILDHSIEIIPTVENNTSIIIPITIFKDEINAKQFVKKRRVILNRKSKPGSEKLNKLVEKLNRLNKAMYDTAKVEIENLTTDEKLDVSKKVKEPIEIEFR